LRELAAGPISAVFVGRREGSTGRGLVAVKLLRDLPEGGVDRLLSLRDRARRVGRLGHRHHAVVHDVARVDTRFAFISPYVDGIDLIDWIDVLGETGVVLPRRVSCEILRATAVGLEAAFSGSIAGADRDTGVVHRDLKPSNLLVTRDGELKITDFGTGYTALAGREARSGALKKGLVRYLSPERRDGHRSKTSADVYALGIVALELFRGKWLRRLRSQNPAHDRYLADVVARIEDLQMRSDADDRGLRNLLLRMVAHDPEARPELDEIVTTFRALADRAAGPSLESFAVANAVPWLEAPPQEADERLEGVHALIVERGQPLPEPAAGESLPVVSLPDRYDLQLAAGLETGEWGVDDGMPEVTDPRTPATADPPPVVEVELDDDFDLSPDMATDPGAHADSAPPPSVEVEVADTPVTAPVAAWSPEVDDPGSTRGVRWLIVAVVAVAMLGLGAGVVGIAAWAVFTLR
jgi:hypothetical protein